MHGQGPGKRTCASHIYAMPGVACSMQSAMVEYTGHQRGLQQQACPTRLPCPGSVNMKHTAVCGSMYKVIPQPPQCMRNTAD